MGLRCLSGCSLMSRLEFIDIETSGQGTNVLVEGLLVVKFIITAFTA